MRINNYTSHQNLPDDPRINSYNQDDDHDLEERTGLTRQEREENYWADKGEELYQQNLEEDNQ